MMDFIMVPAVMTIITLGVYKLFELFVCKKERIMLIEKMDERGLLPQMDTPKLRGSSFSFSALKIGCLLAGMGLGLLLGYLYLLCDDSQLLYCGQRLDVVGRSCFPYLWGLCAGCWWNRTDSGFYYRTKTEQEVRLLCRKCRPLPKN